MASSATDYYNNLNRSKGKNDACYTYRYAVEPLLEFLEPFRDKIIWCPFDRKDSEFVQVLSANNYKVVHSHIAEGKDFYRYKPRKFDLIVSNPPFSGKRAIVERCLGFGKPFCLLLPITWLNDAAPLNVFEGKSLELLVFDKRMQFKNQDKSKQIPYSCAYFCHEFLPEKLIRRHLEIEKKKRSKRDERSSGEKSIQSSIETKQGFADKVKQIPIDFSRD